MRSYSLDLRERVAAAVDHHEGSIWWIARVFRVSTSFIVRLLQRRPRRGKRSPPSRMPEAFHPRPSDRTTWMPLAEVVREQPDATLEQLRQRGGFTWSLKTLWLALDHLHLTFKKKSLHASQRDWPDVQTKRCAFRRKVRPTAGLKKLVFVDETGVTTAMTPTYARAPRGERAVGAPPRPRGRRSP